MSVLVSGTASVRGINRRLLARKAKAALEAVALGGWELSVALVGDGEIRRLNREYRRRDRPTDVLSFSLREGRFGSIARSLGDVVISLETAVRQADEQGASLGDEVDRLLVHGILHLAGYDHEVSEREARRMRRKENAILRMLRRSCG